MAIKRGSKVDKSFSSASMTDLIFLLLLFMLIATTLINPNAIKLILPKSSNQLKDKAMTTIWIQVLCRDGKRRLARGRGESPQVPAGGTGEPYRFAALRQVGGFRRSGGHDAHGQGQQFYAHRGYLARIE